MLEDYLHKDKLARHFHETGSYPGCKKMDEFQVPHLKLNAVTFAHNSLVLLFFYALGCLAPFLKFFAGSVVFVAVTCTIGKSMSNGMTMESIPFETAIKSVMMALYARKIKKQMASSSGEKQESMRKQAKTAY
mmetsp:Transcript_2565/g.2963  ORF Transcript_2565/g.2963 Transcript_2565/m.2963 type:complete len:133 (-) Transcript_2565:206-604(-)